jgi:hypothetical protein
MSAPPPGQFGNEHKAPSITPNRTRAGVGAVGGGTGLVAIAQSIAPGTTREVLLYLVPFVSFIIGSLLYYLEVQASRYLERRAVNNARRTLVRALDNPRTSAQHKARIRKKLEYLEELETAAELERVRFIGLIVPQVPED